MDTDGESSKFMRSIKKKLLVNFVFIIMITVVILEILLTVTVRQNYYNNLEEMMTNQIKTSSEVYSKYFSDSTLQDNVLNNVDTFWKQTSAEVQIVDLNGSVIMDSIGANQGNINYMSDFKNALNGKKGKWIGKVNYDTAKIMAVSYPLRNENKIVGVLRFVTSLREVNKDIRKTAYAFALIGAVVIVICGFVSIVMANFIVEPLDEITKTAEIMAGGNFNVRSTKKYNNEFDKLSDTMNYMAGEILKREQLKNEFMSSVSHELRTPLTSIKGWAVTLNDGEFKDYELLEDGLTIIEKESDRLTEMVEELLDFSKFVSGKMVLKKEKVDVTALVSHLQKEIMPRALRENINFNVQSEADLPTIISDENRLKQLFINIIDNAFNFTQSGGNVNFDVTYKKPYMIFCVKDSGCGIPPEELPRVKEKFYKGKTSKSKNGIGLSICDEIVKLMNGSLNIKSKVGCGTEVIIELPVSGMALQEGDKN